MILIQVFVISELVHILLLLLVPHQFWEYPKGFGLVCFLDVLLTLLLLFLFSLSLFSLPIYNSSNSGFDANCIYCATSELMWLPCCEILELICRKLIFLVLDILLWGQWLKLFLLDKTKIKFRDSGTLGGLLWGYSCRFAFSLHCTGAELLKIYEPYSVIRGLRNYVGILWW